MLSDIEAGQIDVVVVYKIDRLTRSLADFAKLVEIFDARSVSFVAVTQQFNTTTSMGRLTLNVLLSFAQFERELASERVRDKIAASRKKGKWTGGSVPLGYDVKEKRLVVNHAEAKTVRTIFTRYVALKSFQKLIDELNSEGIVTKARPVASKTIGGISFTYGPLAYLLKNRTYLGETGHDGHWFSGEHEPILSREIFEAVQQLLKANSAGRTGRRHRSGALLAGLLFDDRGNRMSPSFTTKRGVRYPFYVSSALLRGRKSEAGSAPRVSAAEIDAAVIITLRSHINGYDTECSTPQDLVEQKIDRVVVKAKSLTIGLKDTDGLGAPIEIPWSPANKSSLVFQIGQPGADSDRVIKPRLAQAVVRAHVWLRLLLDGSHPSIDDLARAAGLHPKVIRSRIRLAYLAPDITGEILQGTQRPSLTLNKLTDLAALPWNEQLRLLESVA